MHIYILIDLKGKKSTEHVKPIPRGPGVEGEGLHASVRVGHKGVGC